MAKAKNKGKPEILRTRADVANRFGVSTRTVADWLNDPDFPGKPAKAGIRSVGKFPVAEIAAWRAEKLASASIADETTSSVNKQIQAERLRKLRLENDEMEGRLIDAELVQRLMARTAAMAKQMLYQLVFDVPALLPSSLPVIVKEEIANLVKHKLEQISSHIASEYKSLDVRDMGAEG